MDGEFDGLGLPVSRLVADSRALEALLEAGASATVQEAVGLRSWDRSRRTSVTRAMRDGLSIDSVRERPLPSGRCTVRDLAQGLALAIGAELRLEETGLDLRPLRHPEDAGFVITGEVDPSAAETRPGARGVRDPMLFGADLEKPRWVARLKDSWVPPLAVRPADAPPFGTEAYLGWARATLTAMLAPASVPVEAALRGVVTAAWDEPSVGVPRSTLLRIARWPLVGMLMDEGHARTVDEACSIVDRNAAPHVLDPLLDAWLETAAFVWVGSDSLHAAAASRIGDDRGLRVPHHFAEEAYTGHAILGEGAASEVETLRHLRLPVASTPATRSALALQILRCDRGAPGSGHLSTESSVANRQS